MKNEKLAQALEEISDKYLHEAAAPPRKKLPGWVGAVAAVLALAVALGCILPLLQSREPQLLNPTQDTTVPLFHKEEVTYRYLAAAPVYPQVVSYPQDPSDYDAYTQWHDGQRSLHDQPEGYADSLEGYFAGLIPALLKNQEGANTACSPLNIYMALAMLAEITHGNSRQQILDLLKAPDLETLRQQAGYIWKAHYNDDGLAKSILGSSLWLDGAVEYNEDTAALLAEHYYASIFRGDLGSEEMNEELRAWLNGQTDGLLRQQTEGLELSADTLLALATTVCYQVQWQEPFQEEDNTEGIFHTPDGDVTATFMNQTLSSGPYYWGEHFGAVYLNLEDGSRMWLFLPQEGYAPEDILEETAAFLSHKPGNTENTWENKKHIRVNLSLPKFDVTGELELSQTLKDLGVTEIFENADFTPIFPEQTGGAVSKVTHNTRVAIDEEGVTAAAYTLILYCGGTGNPDEMDLTLDRPFLFYVESRDGLPLFTGTVNNP